MWIWLFEYEELNWERECIDLYLRTTYTLSWALPSRDRRGQSTTRGLELVQVDGILERHPCGSVGRTSAKRGQGSAVPKRMPAFGMDRPKEEPVQIGRYTTNATCVLDCS